MKSRINLALAPFFTCLVFLSSCSSFKSTSTIEHFYYAIAEGNAEEAISLVSEPTLTDFGVDNIQAGLTRRTVEIQAKGGIKRLSIQEKQRIEDLVKVIYIIEYEDGTKEKNMMKLMKENEEWKIHPRP